MKKFEEELKRPNNAGIDPFSKRDVSFEKLSSKFTKGAQTLKEWKEYAFKAEDRIKELEFQLEKQQPEIPEVPQFMDEWLKSDNLENLIDTWYNHTADLPENVKDYLDSLGEDVTTSEYCYKEIVHLIARAKLDGYTVAKEKRFYLKHKSVIVYDCNCGCGNSDTDELYLMADGNFAIFKGDAYKFTQSEIDSMETGSYEQIPVKEVN